MPIYDGVNGVAREVKKKYDGVANFTKRTLPSGYTQVEYIESSGTQHIDTGFKPNQNTRMVIDIYLPVQSSYPKALFGGRNGDMTSDKSFVLWAITANSFRTEFDTNILNIETTPVGRFKIDKNKSTTSINGTTYTNTSSTFQSDYSICLFSLKDVGGVDARKMEGRIYSCQIYDNDMLVRDFVPCTNSSGVAGLYDVVNDVFYTNAGSGTFNVGTSTASIVREVTKAYDGVDGVAREYFSSGAPISEMAVGDSVFLNVDNVPTEFLIVHKGNPSTTYYDSSCDGTWLLMKNTYENRVWDSTDNDYENSDIHSYLNNTFLNLLDSDIQSVIKQVKIPYAKGNGNDGTLKTRSDGLSTKVFLLSVSELGFRMATSDGTTHNFIEGEQLSYFTIYSGNDNMIAYSKDGSAVEWWLRSPWKFETMYPFSLNTTGATGWSQCTYLRGIRPALILPSETLVDSSFNVMA